MNIKLWDVIIMNNYYSGRYYDYGPRKYPVLAHSAKEAKQVVLDNADDILEDLLSKRLHNKKRLVAKSHALDIEESNIGLVYPGRKITTYVPKLMYSPHGRVHVTLREGNVISVEEGLI